MGGNQTSAISLTQAILENLSYCFVTQNDWFIHDIKNGFIIISVSVHVTFKYVKVMHLSCYSY